MYNSKELNGINRHFYHMPYVYIALIYLCISFYIMNSSTPLRCDDLIYQYQWIGERTDGMREPIDLGHRVENFSEAFMSQINHYKVMNGRFIVHYLVQSFCGFIGKPIFNIINTLIYLIFLIGCIRFLKISSSTGALTALSLLWLGIPIQHIFYYSISFSINYLWPSSGLIWFYILFDKYRQNSETNIFKIIYIFFYSLLLGSMHEGFSLPLSGVLFLYLLSHRKQVNTSILIMSVGVWLGTASIIFAPGTIGRGANSASSISLSDYLSIKQNVLLYSKRLYLFTLAIILLLFTNKMLFKEYLRKRILEISFIILDFCFVLALPNYSQRIEFPLELTSLLLSIELFMLCRLWKEKRRIICSIILSIALLHIPITVYYTCLVNKEYNEMLQSYIDSPKGFTRYNAIKIPKPINSYVKRLDDGVERDYISFTMGKEMVIERE